LREVREPPTSRLLDRAALRAWVAQVPEDWRGNSTLRKAVKWSSIVGLLALAGLWSRVTPFEVLVRFLVDAGAILVMARAILARRYAVAAVATAFALLYNPMAPVFGLSGDWQRAALVASAVPFLVSLVWRDMRTEQQCLSEPFRKYGLVFRSDGSLTVAARNGAARVSKRLLIR
jgi:hypothetical protein